MSDKKIHFGWWVAWKRRERGFHKQADFAAKVGIGERRMSQIEQLAEPPDSSTTPAIAQALGYRLDDLDSFSYAWRTQPVAQPPTKAKSGTAAKGNPPDDPRASVTFSELRALHERAKSEGRDFGALVAELLESDRVEQASKKDEKPAAQPPASKSPSRTKRSA